MTDFPEALVPVIDVLHGQAVHGRSGNRSEYRTLAEAGLGSSDPIEVAWDYRRRFGVTEIYLADIDSLHGETPNFRLYAQLIDQGFRLIVDAAWTAFGNLEVDSALQELAHALVPIISVESLATQSLWAARDSQEPLACRSTGSVAEITAMLTLARKHLQVESLFSLDLKQGSLWLGPNATKPEDEPHDAAAHQTHPTVALLNWIDAAVASGFQKILLLDLADVGSGRGTSTIELLRTAQARHEGIEWWGGGGIRDRGDVRRLCEAGFQKLLIASALHQRKAF